MSDKGIALQRIAARLGVDASAVMAVGNRLSDTGMMGWSGGAVTVADAPSRVRQLARDVVPGGVSDAVSRVVWQYVLHTRATSSESDQPGLGKPVQRR
jgi:hydroxymethylpyrimidine pyrophosphatase-like HAD family hydrolase